MTTTHSDPSTTPFGRCVSTIGKHAGSRRLGTIPTSGHILSISNAVVEYVPTQDAADDVDRIRWEG